MLRKSITTRQQFVRLCDCGCQQPTLLSDRTNQKLGLIGGEPMRYIHGHYTSTKLATSPRSVAAIRIHSRLQFVQLCACGCGEPTKLSVKTETKRGQKRGQPQKYVSGHAQFPKNLDRKAFKSRTGIPAHARYAVDDHGCWNWLGSINKVSGDGVVNVNGKNIKAYRYFYEQAKGTIPRGYHIDHLCRNRACVNPDHLEAVTRTENARRAITTRLSMQKARQIRAQNPQTNAEIEALATEYGVTGGTIWAVVAGRSWRENAA